jgi:hypothetical protein
MKQLLMILAIFILAACAPRADEQLPTLARLPTETEGASPTTDLTQVASGRIPLPATFTPTFTPTLTATLDPSITPTLTATVTVTPSATITETPTLTASPLPTLDPDVRPILSFAFTAAAATILPADFVVPPYEGINVTLSPVPLVLGGTLPPGIPSAIPPLGTVPTQAALATTCSILPTGGFGAIFQSNPDVAAQIACPTDGNAQSVSAAWQSFEQGMMVWLNGEIIVFYNVNDNFQSLPDTFVAGVDPETSSEVPPAGLFTPIRGFLKIWSGNSAVRNGLGWATSSEQGVTATVMNFQNGRMIWLQNRNDILVMIGLQSGNWLSFQGQF